jgi:hypothetical protein
MKGLAISASFLSLFGGALWATPIIDLTLLSSGEGSFITRGQDWHVVYNSPADLIKADAYHPDSDWVELATFGQLSMFMAIQVGGYGHPVTVGQYHSAPQGSSSDTNLFLGFDGRSDSDTQMFFTVNAIQVGLVPLDPDIYPLQYLDVSFREIGWSGVPLFSGRVVFDANPIPEPSTRALFLAGFSCLLSVFRFKLGSSAASRKNPR